MSSLPANLSKALPAHRRHDIDERAWKLLEPHLPGRKGAWGGIARDNRTFINAVFWILRTGAPCHLTEEIGRTPIGAFAAGATSACGRLCWQALVDDPDYE
jgi:hypothetical protein